MKSLLSLLILSAVIISCDTKATLEIKSNVENAEVFVNEKSVGAAPIKVSVESGDVTIGLVKEGYKNYKSIVKLESGDNKVLNARMKANASVTLNVSANRAEADVYLNNKSIGQTPLSKKVASGNANISVRKNGYVNYEESLNLSANSTIDIEADLITDLEAIRAVDEANFRSNNSGTFTDTRDGQQYEWVKIGNRIWMAENMNYPVEARSWPYGNDSTNRVKYGMLYSQRGAKEVGSIPGWRVPSNNEWQSLIKANGTNAYSKLINGGSTGINIANGGIYNYFAKYADKGKTGYYWSSTRNDGCELCGYSWVFDKQTKTISQNPESYISMGFSVRLVRDVR